MDDARGPRGHEVSEQRVFIREERPDDHVAVFALTERAFGQPEEAELVEAVRAGAAPIVSLVAEREGEDGAGAGEIIGHILFSPVTVRRPDGSTTGAMGLGPMAVSPEHQRQGIGGRLIGAGLRACRERGENVVVVLGHADYYPRFGFVPAAEHGLRYRSVELDPYFFVIELVGGALDGVTGEVTYHAAFEAL